MTDRVRAPASALAAAPCAVRAAPPEASQDRAERPSLWVLAALTLVGLPAVLVGLAAALLAALVVTPLLWLGGARALPSRARRSLVR